MRPTGVCQLRGPGERGALRPSAVRTVSACSRESPLADLSPVALFTVLLTLLAVARSQRWPLRRRSRR